MSTRRSKARWATTAAAITTGLGLSLTGCGGGDEAPPDKEETRASVGRDDEEGAQNGGSESGQPLAQVTGGDITLAITSAVREHGGFVTVEGELTNSGSTPWTGLEWKPDETELAMVNRSSMADAKLLDKQGKKRYYILRDTEGRCLCTSFTGGVGAGESTNWYAQFPAPPKGNDEVDFQIADMPPASVTISEG